MVDEWVTSEELLVRAHEAGYEFLTVDVFKDYVRRGLFPSPREMKRNLGEKRRYGVWGRDDLLRLLDLCSLHAQNVRAKALQAGLWTLGHDVEGVEQVLTQRVREYQTLLLGQPLSPSQNLAEEDTNTINRHVDNILARSKVLDDVCYRNAPTDGVDGGDIQQALDLHPEVCNGATENDLEAVTEPMDVHIPTITVALGRQPREGKAVLDAPLPEGAVITRGVSDRDGARVHVTLPDGSEQTIPVTIVDEGEVSLRGIWTEPEPATAVLPLIGEATGSYPNPAIAAAQLEYLQVRAARDVLAGVLNLDALYKMLSPAEQKDQLAYDEIDMPLWSLLGFMDLFEQASLEQLTRARWLVGNDIIHVLHEFGTIPPRGQTEALDLPSLLAPHKGDVRRFIASPKLAPLVTLLVASRLYYEETQARMSYSMDRLATAIKMLVSGPETKQAKRDALLLILSAMKPVEG